MIALLRHSLFSTFSLKFVGKLKKWDTVDEVHRTIDIPEAPKVGSSGKMKVDKSGIPLPPPPPPAHLLKQLHIQTKNDKGADDNGDKSPISSFYSPGKNKRATSSNSYHLDNE